MKMIRRRTNRKMIALFAVKIALQEGYFHRKRAEKCKQIKRITLLTFTLLNNVFIKFTVLNLKFIPEEK